MQASPRPWSFKRHRVANSYYLRIYDANGARLFDCYPHESVGGRGLEQGESDVRLVVALVNSPAAAAFEADPRHAQPAEIPEADRPALQEARLL